MKEVVRWLLEAWPQVSVRTLDPIPRQSPKSVFVMTVRSWAASVQCVEEGRHKHCICWRRFVLEREGGGRWKEGEEEKEGKEKEGTRNKFQLRRELYGKDGVHLSCEVKMCQVANRTDGKGGVGGRKQSSGEGRSSC